MSFKRKYNASDDVTQESNSRQSVQRGTIFGTSYARRTASSQDSSQPPTAKKPCIQKRGIKCPVRSEILSAPSNRAPVSKKTYEFWAFRDLCFRTTAKNLFSTEGCSRLSDSSSSFSPSDINARSLRSNESETSRSCLTNSSDTFNETIQLTFPEHEYELMSQGRYRPLFEKLLLSIHSKRRVEMIKNFLSTISLSRRQDYSTNEMAGEDPATSSPYLALRDRIQDSRIKLKFYAKLQREQRDSLQALNLRISDLTEKKASLLKSIGDIKQRIALKNKFTEKLNQEVTQKLEADFKVRIKNSKELFLKSSAAKSNCEVRFPTKGEATALDAYTLIQGYLSNIKEVKEEEFSRPTFGTPANLKLRHQARVLATQFSQSTILEEIAAETTAGATRLANFPNLALLATFKPKAMLDARSIYQEKMSEYFSAVSPLDYSVRQLCQDFRKSLLPKQLELKEKMLQLQEVKNELWNKIDAHCGANDPYYTDLERQRLYSRSILRALESVQIPSAEAIYQPPPLLKLRLSSGLEPNSALRKAARELAQVFEQLRHNRDSVMSLCRNLSSSVLNPPHLQDLGTLNFAELGKDASKWIASELQQTDRTSLDGLTGVTISPAPIPSHVAAQFPAPLADAQIVSSSTLTINSSRFWKATGPFGWYRSPDAFLPLLVELKTQARLTHQLCSSLRRQACSHEATWDRSLRLWNSGSDRASDGVLDTSGFCEVEFRLGELASRAEASWAQLLDVCCPALLHANIVDIPNARALLHEIKEILCERDELLKTFAL